MRACCYPIRVTAPASTSISDEFYERLLPLAAQKIKCPPRRRLRRPPSIGNELTAGFLAGRVRIYLCKELALNPERLSQEDLKDATQRCWEEYYDRLGDYASPLSPEHIPEGRHMIFTVEVGLHREDNDEWGIRPPLSVAEEQIGRAAQAAGVTVISINSRALECLGDASRHVGWVGFAPFSVDTVVPNPEHALMFCEALKTKLNESGDITFE